MIDVTDKPCRPAHAPTLADPNATPRLRNGYRRRYLVPSSTGQCQLQQVRCRIHFTVADELVADFRQVYTECFVFDSADSVIVDTHDFDLWRDGWRISIVRDLLTRHRRAGDWPPCGPATLTVRKRFEIASGAIDGAETQPAAGGGSFGFLADGPRGPSRASLRLARGDGSWHELPLPPCPAGFPVAGRGSFATARRARTFEQFRYSYAKQTGSFVDRQHYRTFQAGEQQR